jgi:cell wall-associated NlpC family hydrolase
VITAVAGALLLGFGGLPAAAEPSPGPNAQGKTLTRQQLVQRISKSSQQLEVVVERYNQLREDLRTTVNQVGVIKRQLGPLQKQVDQHRAKVGVIATAAYTTAGSVPLNALLHAETTREVIDQLMVLQILADDQQQQIANLNHLRQQYEAAQSTLKALVEQGRAQQKQLSSDRAKIESDLAQLQRWRNHAYGPGGQAPTTANARKGWVKPELSGAPAKILDFALDQLGKTYRWAADGPDAYDCSGLVLAAYKLVGKALPHNSVRQYDAVKKIKRDQLQPGDLIFYYRDLHHVGIYIGGGRMIHAPTFGEKVRIDMVDELPVRGYGRVESASTSTGARG